MMKLNGSSRIVITGAGGWLGREVLEFLVAVNGPEIVKEFVICLGSADKEIKLSDGTNLHSGPLLTFEPSPADTISGVVHLGFLTRDKYATLGFEKYVSENVQITSSAVRIIETVAPDWVATVSSGAIFSDADGNVENDVTRNPYGFTKRIEEELLTNAANRVGANIAIGRLWGALGTYMPINRNYAISDFIVQAIETGEIVIRADHKVFRRYCDASDFMNLLMRCATQFKNRTFDSGGHLIELSDLAELIAQRTASEVLERSISESAPLDDYYPQNEEFEILARELGFSTQSFESSLDATLKTHLAASSGSMTKP